MEEWQVTILLAALVEKSLVVYEESTEGQSRYRLLESVRQYAGERLRASGEETAGRARHHAYFLRLAKEAEPHLIGPQQKAWLERLEAEHDNLRLALDWCGGQADDVEQGLQLTSALWQFWVIRGHLHEGLLSLLEALSRVPAARTPAPADALNSAGSLSRLRGDYAAARRYQEESLAIRREMGNRQGIANTLNNLGNVACDQGDYAAGRAYYEESLAIEEEIDDRLGAANTAFNLGILAHAEGDNAAARSLFEHSLTLQRELGNSWGVANALAGLSELARIMGDHVTMRALMQQSLALQRELGDTQGVADSLKVLADLAALQGYPLRAARLYGVVDTLRAGIGAPVSLDRRAQDEREMTTVREALGEEIFTAAFAAGQALPWEQAVEYALQETLEEGQDGLPPPV